MSNIITNSIIKNFCLVAFTIYIIFKIFNFKGVSKKVKAILFLGEICLSSGFLLIKINLNLLYAIFFLLTTISIIIKKCLKKDLLTSITAVCLSMAICFLSYGLSAGINYLVWNKIKCDNRLIQLNTIILLWFIFIVLFFKIKRFKKGFAFVNRSKNNEFNNLVTINISIVVIFIYCLVGTILYDETTRNLLISFSVLGFTMIDLIQKSFTMYYKQKLLQDNLQQYKNDLAQKDQELQKIKDEKYKISKLTHEFYNRQKALELAVKENTQNKDLINRIHNLTEEYSEELTKIKMPNQLPETGITEIDDMFKYMQKECNEKNIKIDLKVEGDIYHLINNIIPKNKLETLIGDHIRDAINAVNIEEVEIKEILVIIGIKDNKYELCIYDTGIEFKKETLLKLGQENVTTNKDKGGQGIGYMTTFETLNQTGASLIIEEYETGKGNNYTKAVKFRFDGKREYKICSYRADEIKKENKDRNIIIEEI